MRGHEQVVTLLNEVLTAELTAINQYFIHGRMCENWGSERLWKKIREETVPEQLRLDLEHHANWIEAQTTSIAQTGEGNYLAQQIKDGE
jgi:bacterioferritin (cytochrome b1)